MIRVLLTSLLLAASAFPAAANTRDFLKKTDDWFRSAACRERLANLLSHQDQAGCWPKNLDPTEKPYRGEQKNLKGTFDNSATVNELRLLARAYQVTSNDQNKGSIPSRHHVHSRRPVQERRMAAESHPVRLLATHHLQRRHDGWAHDLPAGKSLRWMTPLSFPGKPAGKLGTPLIAACSVFSLARSRSMDG